MRRSDPVFFGVQTVKEILNDDTPDRRRRGVVRGHGERHRVGHRDLHAADHREHHRLVADEPQPIGDDTGPTPYDLLLAALGACTSVTVGMYANRKGWPLERVRVTLRHSRIHAQDCADCETRIGWIDHIDRDIELAGNLNGTQRHRLLDIANRCPVHQTLTSEVHIATSLR
jgi:putative redox protein